MSARNKAILWWAAIVTTGLILILVAVFSLDDGHPRDVIGIFSNGYQVALAAIGVGFMLVAIVVLVIGLLRRA
jgi:uncharacterized membrane protein